MRRWGKLYDIIRATNQYYDEHLHDLNVFLTRLLFCFFAEDGIFPIQGQMTKAIESLTKTDGSDMDNFFERLFWMLDMEPGRLCSASRKHRRCLWFPVRERWTLSRQNPHP